MREVILSWEMLSNGGPLISDLIVEFHEEELLFVGPVDLEDGGVEVVHVPKLCESNLSL